MTRRPGCGRIHDTWTDEERERVKAFATNGASVLRAAAALKRSMKSVRVEARRLGTPFPSTRGYRERMGLGD
jgi:hypothetical protein